MPPESAELVEVRIYISAPLALGAPKRLEGLALTPGYEIPRVSWMGGTRNPDGSTSLMVGFVVKTVAEPARARPVGRPLSTMPCKRR